MTIGANMSIRSALDALVRNVAKEPTLGDRQEQPDGQEGIADFKLLLKDITPQQKKHMRDDTRDEKLTQAGDIDAQDDALPAPVQGMFGQSILAFEHRLDRQSGDDDTSMPAVKTDAAPGETIAEIAMEAPLTASASDGDAVPQEDSKFVKEGVANPAETAKASDTRANAQAPAATDPPVMPKQQPVSAATPPMAGTPDSDIPDPGLPAVKKDRANASEPPAEQKTTSPTPSALPQINARSISISAPAAAAPVTRPAITDVQIISDRSNGVARTLVIQLQPVELGTVTARLRLTLDGMHIQITAENAAMAEHLSKDHDVLSKELHRAGVTGDATMITISVLDRSAGAGSPQTGQHNLNGQGEARPGNQPQSGFQGTPEDRAARQQAFGETVPDEQSDKLAKPVSQSILSRGLMV